MQFATSSFSFFANRKFALSLLHISLTVLSISPKLSNFEKNVSTKRNQIDIWARGLPGDRAGSGRVGSFINQNVKKWSHDES